MAAITASSPLGYETTSLAHLYLRSSPILLCRTSQALSGWIGSFAAQLFSGLSRDVRSGSSPGSGGATQGHSETCPEVTPALANSKQAVMCLLLRSGFRLATPDWWSAAEMDVLLEGSTISTKELWNSVRVTIVFLVTSLTKALLPQLLSLARRKALGRIFFHLRMMKATVFLGTFNDAEMFWYLSSNLYFNNPVSELYGHFL